MKSAFSHICLTIVVACFQDNYANFPPETGTQSMLIMRVIDGDTVEAAYLIPTRIRLHGINATEKKDDQGKSKKALSDILKVKEVYNCELKGREKYGRLLGDFKIKDGKSASAIMIETGNARPWDGKGQKP